MLGFPYLVHVGNTGALVAGPLVDILTLYYNGKNESNSDATDMEVTADESDITTSSSWIMTNNRAIILSGVVANFIAVFVAFSVREIKVDNATTSKNLKQSPPHDESGFVLGSASSLSEHDIDDECNENNNDGQSSGMNSTSTSSNKVSRFQPIKGSSYQILSETVRTPSFHRFLLVCLLTINVRMVFRHL